MVSAWRGRTSETGETEDLIEMTERDAGARGDGIGVAVSAYASEYQEVVAENWG